MEDAVKRPMFFKVFMAEHSSERMVRRFFFFSISVFMRTTPHGPVLSAIFVPSVFLYGSSLRLANLTLLRLAPVALMTCRPEKIPVAFQDYIKGQRPRAVSLTGPSGDSWMVGLIEEEGALYFGRGWPKFVEDNSVQTGDFMVFRYDGEAGFEVQVFDPTMSPREASFLAWNSNRVTAESIRSNDVVLIKQESDTDGASGSSGTDHFSFQITMKTYHVKQAILPIPRSFSERHIRCHGKYGKVVLSDQRGKQWPVGMIRRKDITKRESWLFSKGFSAFICDNRVKEGDTCTFELVGPSLLRVCISRALEEEANQGS
ncbi:hypothetical protein BT93_F0433 [Corymbia citriodora subsp. variegata]|nr:hypothetical protein BT93_F0433 [Corymbia citriodora subsp. variegata]